MRLSVKFLSLILALLMLVMCAVSCGGGTEETKEQGGEGSETETEGKVETEDPRQAVKDDIPTDLNFANAADNKVTFFVRDDTDAWKYELDVDAILDDTLYDAVYRRNQAIEERLGVEITQMSQLGNWGNHTEWLQTLRNTVNTKSGDFDSAAIYMTQGAPLALEGMYYNVAEFPNINLDKPWWNKNLREELLLFDTLYFLAGDIAISEVSEGMCMFYNKDMFEQYYATQDVDLYQLVREGQWTLEKLYELVSNVWEDNNANGVIDNGDAMGYTQAVGIGAGALEIWAAALGIEVTEKVDGYPVFSVYNERTVEVYEALQRFHLDNPGLWVTDHGDGTVKDQSGFSLGNVMFNYSKLGAGSSLRDVAFSYGVLPLPKYDTEQEEYRTSCNSGASLIVVLSSCPVEKTEMMGATLELMAAGSYKEVVPAYYEIVLKSKYSDNPQDAEMYDLILNSFVFNFSFVYTATLGTIWNMFRDLRSDFAQKYEADEERFETLLETLVDKLDEISFNAMNP